MWIKETRSILIAETVFIKHGYIMMPEVSKADAIVDSTMYLARSSEGRNRIKHRVLNCNDWWTQSTTEA